MIKKKQQFGVAAFIISAGILVAGILGMSARPAYAAEELKCSILPQSLCSAAQTKNTSVAESGIMSLLKLVLKIMTAGVGILAVGALIYAGILYGSAADNASQTAAAKKLITNTVIGIVSYAAMVLFINFLIPGGVFG